MVRVMDYQLQLLLAFDSLLFSHKGQEEVTSFCGKKRKINNTLPLLQTHSSSHTHTHTRRPKSKQTKAPEEINIRKTKQAWNSLKYITLEENIWQPLQNNKWGHATRIISPPLAEINWKILQHLRDAPAEKQWGFCMCVCVCACVCKDWGQQTYSVGGFCHLQRHLILFEL